MHHRTAPGQLARVDYEYCRNGTVNLFVAVDAHRSWRKVSVTERRTAQDYAERLRELVDVDYPMPRASGSCRTTCPPTRRARSMRPFRPRKRIASWSGWSSTIPPKHASWLNMVEIEIGVLKGQCLDRRINNQEDLEGEIAAWERQRNASGARIKWMFTTEKARAKNGPRLPQTERTLQPARQGVIITVPKN